MTPSHATLALGTLAYLAMLARALWLWRHRANFGGGE